MKLKFKMVGQGESKVTVTVVIEAAKYTLTRDEMRRWKSEMQDSIHRVLREQDYSVADIKIASS